jgi:MtrB/PioB family decaheme-associated outer membrane protein
MDRVTTAVNLGYSRRRASTYHDNAPFLGTHSPDYIATQAGVGLWENHPLLRRYYLNDRDRTEVGMSTTYIPTDTLSVGFNVNYRDDDFDDPTVGLTNRRMTNYMLDVSYAPMDKTQAHAFYSYENTRFDQAGWYFRGGASKAGMSSDPNNQWWSKAKDHVHTLGFGFKTKLIEDKLDLVVDYLYSQSRDEIHMNGKVTAGDPAFPDTVSRLHDVRVGLEYKLRENLSVRVGYLFEKFTLDDWAYDGILPDSVDELITIGEESPDYKSHLVTWSFVYKF